MLPVTYVVLSIQPGNSIERQWPFIFAPLRRPCAIQTRFTSKALCRRCYLTARARIIRHEIVTNCIHGKCISWLYAPRVVSIVVAESISLCPSLTFDWPFLLIERGNRASRTLESGRQLSPSTRNVFTDFSGLKRKKKKRDEKLLRNIFAEINGGRKREFFSFFFRKSLSKSTIFFVRYPQQCRSATGETPRDERIFQNFPLKLIEKHQRRRRGGGGVREGGRKSGIEFFVTKRDWILIQFVFRFAGCDLLTIGRRTFSRERRNVNFFFFFSFFVFQVNSGYRVSVNNKFMQQLAPFVTSLRQALLIEDKSIPFFNFARNQFEFNFVPSRRLTTWPSPPLRCFYPIIVTSTAYVSSSTVPINFIPRNFPPPPFFPDFRTRERNNQRNTKKS